MNARLVDLGVRGVIARRYADAWDVRLEVNDDDRRRYARGGGASFDVALEAAVANLEAGRSTTTCAANWPGCDCS